MTVDGVKWSEVFATDSNILSSTRIALGSISATKLRVVMHEACGFASVQCLLLVCASRRQVHLFRGRLCMGYRRCLWGHTDCKALLLIAQQQAKAATPVTNISKPSWGSSRLDPAKHCEVSFQLWRLALTSKRFHCNCFCAFAQKAARASLASVVSALAGALPKMKSCHGAPAAAAAFLKSEGVSMPNVMVLILFVRFLLSGSSVMLARSVDGNMRSVSTREQMAENVDRQNGVNAQALSALFKESRRIIIASRSALF